MLIPTSRVHNISEYDKSQLVHSCNEALSKKVIGLEMRFSQSARARSYSLVHKAALTLRPESQTTTEEKVMSEIRQAETQRIAAQFRAAWEHKQVTSMSWYLVSRFGEDK